MTMFAGAVDATFAAFGIDALYMPFGLIASGGLLLLAA